MQILNFGHPLGADVLADITQVADQVISQIRDIRVQADQQQSFADQAAALIDSVGLSGEEWQRLPFAVVLPGLSAMAGALLAEIHGRCGYFPVAVRLRPKPGTTPVQFEFAELMHLDAVRQAARTRR